ncbi:hypothetical protein [uncultured Caulobacter sp.]|uniref:hypothetical protein n=1 Tax=uncultured Caulobacter sp. TaxID=158749 RepID=UPI00261210C4|nr:hypothetical protein [uncultured Caulobacter sp.]
MKAPKLNMRALLIAVGALVGGLVVGGVAMACTSGCPPTPPVCCQPPPPPPKPPAPPTGCCGGGGGGGHNVNIPGVNVNIGATVIVNANSNVSAVANSGASSSANASGGSLAGSAGGVTNYFGGGGHGGYYSGPMASGYIQGLNVEGGETRRRESYLATRTKTRRVIVRAVCLDDRDVPHPASQVTPDRDIDEAYDGELYRCIAGSRMQYVVAEYAGQIDISTGGAGQTFICQKNEALYHMRGQGPGQATLACRPQRPARDCNERSLLRRFGAGVKILTIITTETYTAYRDEVVQERQSLTTSFSLDGGVGGVVY